MKVTVLGAGGRMGTEVLNLVTASSQFGLAAAIDPCAKEYHHSIKDVEPSATDVVVDFSAPESLALALEWCRDNNVPLVSGTTGMSVQQEEKLREAAEKIAVMWAPNMSVGICILKTMMQHLSALDEFDYQIEEFHHNQKKDKPSGTAVALQKTLETVVGGSRPEPLSIRGGGIYGIHKVWGMSDEEVIGLQHIALNRQVFARGALKAAKWVVAQPPGLYGMEDVLDHGNRS